MHLDVQRRDNANVNIYLFEFNRFQTTKKDLSRGWQNFDKKSSSRGSKTKQIWQPIIGLDVQRV